MVSAEMRILARSVWNILVFMLNSLIFILIGVQLSAVVSRLEGYTGWDLAAYALAVSMVAIIVRFAWVYFAEYLPAWISRFTGRKIEPLLPGEAFIVSWCGMRGIVSLAAALALPIEISQRDLIIYLTFVVILGSDHSVRDEQRLARVSMGRAALTAIERSGAEGHVQPEVVERIRAEFAERMASGSLIEQMSGSYAPPTRLRLAAVRAERGELIRLWQEGAISDDVLHHLEEELDYEESRL